MNEKPVKLNMSFNEALVRLSRVPINVNDIQVEAKKPLSNTTPTRSKLSTSRKK